MKKYLNKKNIINVLLFVSALCTFMVGQYEIADKDVMSILATIQFVCGYFIDGKVDNLETIGDE